MAERDVFINCPFTPDYADRFTALVFTVVRCGFEPRCTRERNDAGHVRLEAINDLIRECPLGIHDISFTRPDPQSGLPRFNMPFELGLFLGANAFGTEAQRRKRVLVLDEAPYRYQLFLSDIAGQDIKPHHGTVDGLVAATSEWLRDTGLTRNVPGGRRVMADLELFLADLPGIAAARDLEVGELTFLDLRTICAFWIAVPR